LALIYVGIQIFVTPDSFLLLMLTRFA